MPKPDNQRLDDQLFLALHAATHEVVPAYRPRPQRLDPAGLRGHLYSLARTPGEATTAPGSRRGAIREQETA